MLSCFSWYISASWVRPITSVVIFWSHFSLLDSSNNISNYLSIVLYSVMFTVVYIFIFSVWFWCPAAALKPMSGLIMRRHFGSHLVFQAACASVIFASMKQSLVRLMVKIYINSLFCLIITGLFLIQSSWNSCPMKIR